MPLARGNASPMRCAAKRNAAVLHKRQQMRAMVAVAARQHQSMSVIERLQHEQQQMLMAVSMDRKRRRCDDGECAPDKKRQASTSEELCELTQKVHHVQRQVATAAHHIQELRALVHGYVQEQQQQQQQQTTATCSQAICA
ncbi:hypothetical protein Gpo141_00007195 [Globisporangium polare]